MFQEFHYKASTFRGNLLQGQISAPDEQGALVKLQEQGLFPLLVYAAGTCTQDCRQSRSSSGPQEKKSCLFSGRLGLLQILSRRRVRAQDLILFAEQMASMLQSGITVSRSLDILQEQTANKEFASVLREVQAGIREGSPFWQALQKQSRVFPAVFVNMVRAGESAGLLETVLQRLADFLRQIQELKSYLFTSMIYPMILGLTAIASIVLMLTVVMPRFSEIFSSMGVSMPLATQLMLASGDFLRSWWWLLLLAGIGGSLAIKSLLRGERGRQWWDRHKLGLPLLGPVLQKVELARFSRTLGTLLQSGVAILPALGIVQGVVGNSYLSSCLSQAHADLKQGRMLSTALERHGFLPSRAVSMLSVGEESGEMADLLRKIGDMYDQELKSAVRAFTSIFEPLVILVMGLVIGSMVVSMLLGIFSLNELGI